MNHTVESAAHHARLWFTNTKAPNAVRDWTRCLTQAPQRHLEQAPRPDAAARTVACSKQAPLPHRSPRTACHCPQRGARYPAWRANRRRFACSKRRGFVGIWHGAGVYRRPTAAPHGGVDDPHNPTSHVMLRNVRHPAHRLHEYLHRYLTKYRPQCLAPHSAAYSARHRPIDRARHPGPTMWRCGSAWQQLHIDRRGTPRIRTRTLTRLRQNLFWDAACRGAACSLCRGGPCGVRGIAGDRTRDNASWRWRNSASHSACDHADRVRRYRTRRLTRHPLDHRVKHPLRRPALGALPNLDHDGASHGCPSHGTCGRPGDGRDSWRGALRRSGINRALCGTPRMGIPVRPGAQAHLGGNPGARPRPCDAACGR